MISRIHWGAPALTRYTETVPTSERIGIIIHHTVYPEGDSQEDVQSLLREIDQYHRERDFGGIGYNLVVDYAGRLYEARGIDIMGAHTANVNRYNYGVAYMGDTRKRVTAEAVESIKLVVDLLQQHSNKSLAVAGHNEFRETLCPGTQLDKLVRSGEFKRPFPLK
jgi:hypothetical protein